MMLKIESAFNDFAAVESVIASEVTTLTVTVTLKGQHYDPALMDRLLERELEIRAAHPELSLDFAYVPGRNESGQ